MWTASNNPTTAENAGHDHRRLDVQGRVAYPALQIADIVMVAQRPPGRKQRRQHRPCPTPSHVETPELTVMVSCLARGAELTSPEREPGNDEAEAHQRYRRADPGQKRAFRRQIDTWVVNRRGMSMKRHRGPPFQLFSPGGISFSSIAVTSISAPIRNMDGHGSRVKLATPTSDLMRLFRRW